MIHYFASWVLPVASPPIRDGWVAVDRDRIVAVAPRPPAATWTRQPGDREIDLGPAVILPGLVNAHTHLELSYLRGTVPPATEFIAWIFGVMAAQQARLDPAAPAILDAVGRAIAEAHQSGTVLVGDISNTMVTVEPLEAAAMAAVVFRELIGFHPADPDALVDQAVQAFDALQPGERVRPALAAHAPYSVAPLLFQAIRRALDRLPFGVCSVHLAEGREELEFLKTGGGPWRTLLEQVGAWDPAWIPPGGGPVAYLDDVGMLDPRLLAVHGVQLTREDLTRLRARGVTLVTCPRSNRLTGAGVPPVAAFYESGIRVAVGTDSLASCPDLNLFQELAELRRLAPAVPAAALLASATRHGAEALGFEADYGTIEPGKSAQLLAVRLPAVRLDPEEYLVGGVAPADVAWLPEFAS